MATKVRQIVPMAGPAGLYSTGQEWEAGDTEAKNLVDAGLAEIVKPGKPAATSGGKRANGPAKAAKAAATTPEATGAPAGTPGGEAAKGDGE